MTQYPLRTVALDERGCTEVHEATLAVLEGTGVDVHHDKALALLGKAGAQVEGSRVRMPRQLVDEALALAPRSVSVASRGESAALRLESGAVYYGTGSDCIYVLGPGARDRRTGTLADVEAMAALQEKLPGIDFVLSMVAPARATGQPRSGRPVRRHAARHLEAAHHGARRRRASRPLQRDGRGLRRGRQLGHVRHAHAAPSARGQVGRPARALRRAGHSHGVRHGAAPGRYGAGFAGRVPRGQQRRDAERPRDRPTGQPGSALRLRRRPGLDEPAHRA